jgi:hypothetical protein
MEKSRGQKKQITKLIDANGGTIEGTTNTIKSRSEVLPKTSNERKNRQGKMVGFFRQHNELNEQQIELCEGEITFDEAAKAIKQMATEKSPG